MRLAMGIALAALVLASGCSADDSAADDEAKPTEEPSREQLFEPTPEEPSESVDPFAANLGDTALQVGETRDGRDVDTTLHEVRFPLPPLDEFRLPADGNVFMGLRLTQCLDEQAKATTSEPAYATYNGEWSAVGPNGIEHVGSGSSWDDWPSPKFPEHQGMIPGRCMKGWIQIEVPRGLRFSSIIWRPGNVPTAEWVPKT